VTSAQRVLRTTLSAATVAALGGCAAFGTDAPLPSAAQLAELAPPQWYAPAAHQGSVAELSLWWRQFDDPLLARLIDDAERVSPTVSSARARIAQSRADRVAAGAALLPSLDASASAQRGVNDSSGTIATSSSGSLSASWELDLFGGVSAGRDASQARLEGVQALWHDARVSVAAEVATQYIALRACEAQVEQAQIDADSRAETARLTELTARAGFESPANAALARASAAQGHARLTQQRAQCESDIKGLVALTGTAEPTLRDSLSLARGVIARPRQIAVPAVPAALLQQRPDLASAERTLSAAAADITARQADRLPRIRLAGSVGATRYSSSAPSGFVGGINGSGWTWSVGPVSVSLPIFDGGTRRANVEAARAAYTDAVAQYAAALRRAVQEVESALITLQSSAEQQADAEVSASGFADSLRATEARFHSGLGSLFELEDARRSAVQAQTTLIDLRRERVTAWISLYRALGGGWTAATDTVVDAREAPPATPAIP